MKLLIPLSMLILLTGCLTSSSFKNEISTLRTHSNASTTSFNVSNKAKKRSFDFPTIFYPGPDNRYITLSPLPKLPQNFDDGSSTQRSRFGPKKSHRVRPIDFSKLQPITETSARNNFPAPFSQINGDSFHRAPFEIPQRINFVEEQNFVNTPAVTLTTTTFAPPILAHPSRTIPRRRFKQRFHSRIHKQKPVDFFPVTTFRPQFTATDALPNFSPDNNPEKVSSKMEGSSSIFHARPEKQHFPAPNNSPQNVHHREFQKVELIPQTNFVCRPRMNGYFADFETGCQTFHICHDRRRYSFRCPTGTRFSQSILVCDWEHRVKCP